MNTRKPLTIRKLRAEMAMKDLDLRSVARRARVHYTRASEVLSGARRDVDALARLRHVIESAPMPVEVGA